jgi:ABC-type uncharacterized transport system permease subunit
MVVTSPERKLMVNSRCVVSSAVSAMTYRSPVIGCCAAALKLLIVTWLAGSVTWKAEPSNAVSGSTCVMHGNGSPTKQLSASAAMKNVPAVAVDMPAASNTRHVISLPEVRIIIFPS